MKRFLIPLTIAVLIHVFLLRLQGDWVKKRLQAPPVPIALALTYVKPQSPPLPSLPPPQEELREKQAPMIPVTKKIEPPGRPKTLTPEKLLPAKPKNKPPKIRKPRKEIAKKEAPAPAPQPPPEEPKPLEPPASSPPPTRETQPEPAAPSPPTPQQPVGAPSPPRRDSTPAGEHQLAALTPAKALKEAVPIYRRNPPPSYPRIARRKGYEGTVVLEVLVGREGKVSDLRVFQSCGHAVLDEAAADSVRSWLFDPGKLDDDPVEMWVRVPVRFQLKE